MSVFKDKQRGASFGWVVGAAVRSIADGAQVYWVRESDRGEEIIVPVPRNSISRSTAHDPLAVKLESGWIVTSIHRIETVCYRNPDQADG